MADAPTRATTSQVDRDLDAQSPRGGPRARLSERHRQDAALLNAGEVELAKRIEAGLYAEASAEARKRLGRSRKATWPWCVMARRRTATCWKRKPAAGGIAGQIHRVGGMPLLDLIRRVAWV